MTYGYPSGAQRLRAKARSARDAIEKETGRKVRGSFSAHGLLVADDVLQPKDTLARKVYAFIYSRCATTYGTPVTIPTSTYYKSAHVQDALKRLEACGLIMRLPDDRCVVTFPPKSAYLE